MKDTKSATQLADMIEAKMTIRASVGVARQGISSWVAAAVVWGIENAAEADRQAKEIASELRVKYDLADG